MIPILPARQWGHGRPRRSSRELDGDAVHLALRLHPSGVPDRPQTTCKVDPGGRIQARIGVQVQGSQYPDGVHIENKEGRRKTPAARPVEMAGVHEPVAAGRGRPRGVRVRGGVDLWHRVGAAGAATVRVYDIVLADVEPGGCVVCVCVVGCISPRG